MESVVSPSTYVVKGFPDNLMPKVFGQKLSAGALKKIVDYLSQVKAGSAAPEDFLILDVCRHKGVYP